MSEVRSVVLRVLARRVDDAGTEQITVWKLDLLASSAEVSLSGIQGVLDVAHDMQLEERGEKKLRELLGQLGDHGVVVEGEVLEELLQFMMRHGAELRLLDR